MLIDLIEAYDILRVDGGDNDMLIFSLLEAIPSYIETTTGMTAAQQETEPLAKTVGSFLLTLWYNAEQTDSDKLQRTIDTLLKALSVMVKEI